MRQLTEIIVHCSATQPKWMEGRPVEDKIAEIRRWHVQDRGWRDIGYHFLVDRDGRFGIGRPLEDMGAHCKGHNKGTVGICLLGGFGSEADDLFADHFTPAQDAEQWTMISVNCRIGFS